jgi:hypothetical protein
MNVSYNTQNTLLLNNLINFYKNEHNLNKLISIITGESKVSLRIVDWFTTNYSKKYYTNYEFHDDENEDLTPIRFKVYIDYKLKLKAFSKKRFDAFCRSKRLNIPYKNNFVETTLGQLNFFQWAIKNKIIDYIEEHYDEIEKDMNLRNSTSKNKENLISSSTLSTSENKTKTRKKRQELSLSATKSIKKEDIEITVSFH